MSETYSIEATVRENSKHSARECRAAGNVPGVIYGQGKDAKNLAVNYSDFLRLFRRAGQSTLIDLKLNILYRKCPQCGGKLIIKKIGCRS